MKLAKALGVIVAAGIAATTVGSVVYAQGEAGGMSVYGGGAMPPYMRAGAPPRKVGTANCPGVMWDIVQSPGQEKGSLNISGPIWNLDGTGTSMAQGTADPSGHFTLQLTRINGTGPQGTVTGTRNRDGSRDVTLSGPGPCDSISMHLKPGQRSTRG